MAYDPNQPTNPQNNPNQPNDPNQTQAQRDAAAKAEADRKARGGQ
jgi:hypothetical protein